MIQIFIIGVAILAIVFALWQRARIIEKDEGNERMREIARAIREGSNAYLARQARTMSIAALVIAALLWIFFNFFVALGFLIGAFGSAFSGFLGMKTSVLTNSRVAQEAHNGIRGAFRLSFLGGSVTGFLVAGIALMATAGLWFWRGDLLMLIGLSFGGSLISVFSRLGGGIFTKAADVGADLVGKVEANIPEDDPRNPAVIADNVGDNVGDCAGMAADLFETYAVTLVSTMLLGSIIFAGINAALIFPLAIGAASLFGSILAVFFVKVNSITHIMGGLYKGLAAAGIFSAVVFAPLSWILVRVPGERAVALFENLSFIPGNWIQFYLAGLVGLVVTLSMVLITDYYTSKKFRPVKSIAHASESGHAPNIIVGISVGLEATMLPIIVITAGVLVSFWLAGIYGVALAASAMLSLTAIIIAVDAFGPITDNAGGIAEMSHLPNSVRTITDALDSVGNTTKAVTKGYAIASAGLAALVLFSAYTHEVTSAGGLLEFDLTNPLVLAGLFIGGALPYIFASRTMLAVGKSAASVVQEVRNQFREHPGILDGTELPDYKKTVDIVTKSALKEMVVPALMPIVITVAIGFLLGPRALGGFLMGTIITGLFVALSMTSGGAAWDNAKKYIEEGNLGGKGSPAHQAAVTGDTVGDPYKDTAGPAINPLIKVANIVAILIAALLV